VPGLVAFYDIRPGDGVGLFYAPEPTRGGWMTLTCRTQAYHKSAVDFLIFSTVLTAKNCND